VEARAETLQHYMDKRPQKQISWSRIAQSMEGCSYAEIRFLVDEAARTALSDRRPITADDLLNALRENPPTPKGRQEDYL
jgi:ATP-dependent 26S proteasome regulatory subunit